MKGLREKNYEQIGWLGLTLTSLHSRSWSVVVGELEGMALDVAEFLWSKFLDSLEEAESELSGSITISYFKAIKNLISYFKAIKNVVKENAIMPESYVYSETIRVLYELNDALAECRNFTHECRELNKKLLLFNPFTYYFIQKMKSRLKTMKRDFERLASQREENDNIHYPQDMSGPILSSEVFGFDKQVEELERLLLGAAGSSRTGFTAIGVVGIAGVGKTTLVQKVLKSKTVTDKFWPIIWLPFSGKREEEQFSRLSFETCILDNLGHTLDREIVGLGNLVEKLNQLMSGKRYLIVLDDVQRRHINIEDRLWRGLPKGSGGTVIVTSRLTEVAQKLVEQNNLIHVKPLDRENCWRIFEETVKKEVLNISHWETLNNIKEEIKDQCHGLPLAAKVLAEMIPEQIREIESKRFLKEMYIPDELLKLDLEVEPAVDIPNCPVLVFVDIKNEQLGERLYDEFCYRLNKKQVFAVLEENSDVMKKVKAENPESVLKDVYGTLEKLKSKGYAFAGDIQKRMKIIIVGGDAVANWILGVICDLKLPESPSIVPVPQGTESNIPPSFGWKKLNADRESVTSLLSQVTEAQQMKTDSWHILIKMKATQSSTGHQEILHSLHLFRPVHEGVAETADNLKLSGGFWSYFSLGVDAPRSYGAYWCNPTARTLNSFAKVEVMKHGRWELLKIPKGIKSIICLNLPSDLNTWGSSNKKKDQKNLIQSIINDGRLEIIGEKDVFLPQNGRIFLDQVEGIHFEFIEGAAEFVNMRIDGATWKKIPLDGIVDIQISCHSKVNVLANGDCLAKRSIHDSSQPCASGADDDNNAKDNSTDDNDSINNSKGRMKFGPTNTFKIP